MTADGGSRIETTLSLAEHEDLEAFGQAWERGERPQIEERLRALPDAERARLLPAYLARELDCRRQKEELPEINEYLARFPEHRQVVCAVYYEEWPRLPEKFRVTRVLGRGGMGWVLEARDKSAANRHVAIKVIKPAAKTAPGSQELFKRFQREAQVAADLSCRHVVTIYEVGEPDKYDPYFVMPVLQGCELQKRLDERGALSIVEILHIAVGIVRGLQAAHAKGLVHRDIKPRNIWLDSTDDDNVKILDFGLARVLAAEIEFTSTGRVLGTPAYMPPEQAAGKSVEFSADLFNVGLVIYHMASGHRLDVEHRDSAPSLRNLRADLPTALLELVDQLTDTEPNRRPTTSAALKTLEDLWKTLQHTDEPLVPLGYFVPYLPSRFFTGRAPVVAKCRELLESKGRVALFGLGGMGKTQTALAYAHEYGRKQKAYRFVFWANADSDITLTADYIRIAGHLNLPEKANRDQTVVIAAVKDWFEKHDQWLLVVDSANELATVQPFLPQTTWGHILLTTQCPWPGGLAEPLELLPFDPADGALLLSRRAGIIRADDGLAEIAVDDREPAAAISAEFDGLPLALDQAGAYIEVMQVSPADYLHRYHIESNEPQLLADESGIEFRSYPRTIATTWRLNFLQVTQANPAAGDLLRFCSILAPDAIPEEAISAATHKATSLFGLMEPLRLDAALRVAAKFSLLRRDRRSKTVSMHRLVQSVQRHLMDTAEVHTWLQVGLNALRSSYPATAEPKHWPAISRLEPHAVAILSACEDNASVDPLSRAWLLAQFGMYSLARSKIKLGVARLEEARTALLNAQLDMFKGGAETFLEEDVDGGPTLVMAVERDSEFSKAYLFVMENLVHALIEFDPDNPMCDGHLRYLTDAALAVRGANHPEYLDICITAAKRHQKRGELAEAEEILSDVLARAGHSESNIRIRANCLGGLAQCKLQKADYRGAESLLGELMQIGRSKLGEELYASVLDLLGGVYHARNDLGSAESSFRESVKIRKGVLGDQHQAVADGLLKLAMLCVLTGRLAEAEALAQEAAETTKSNFGVSHSRFGKCLSVLVKIYSAQRKNIEMSVEFFGEPPPVDMRNPPDLESLKGLLCDPSIQIRNITIVGRERSVSPHLTGTAGAGDEGRHLRGDGGSQGSRIGRNDPCPCGSGKKFKRCCGRRNPDDTRIGP